MPRKWIFCALACFCLAVLSALVFEGGEDGQGLDAVVQPGADTVRNILETAAVPIKIADKDEERIGRQVLMRYFPVFGPASPKSVYIGEIGNKLVPFRTRREIVYRFYVSTNSNVNAYALPGGFVIVTEGMLRAASNDSELAWVIGHEITHIENKDAVLRLKLKAAREKMGLDKTGGLEFLSAAAMRLLELGYSENRELAADRGGIRLMREAGYDTEAALCLLRKLAGETVAKPSRLNRNPFHMAATLGSETVKSYLATHPHWELRKRAVIQAMENG